MLRKFGVLILLGLGLTLPVNADSYHHITITTPGESATITVKTELPVVVVQGNDLQGAIDSLSGYGGGGKIIIPNRDVLIYDTLNVRSKQGITFEGSGFGSRVVAMGAGFVDKPIFDLTDAAECRFYNFFIRNSGGSRPTTALLLARSSSSKSSGLHSFRDMRIEGAFSQCSVYELASEVNLWSNCYFTCGTGTPYAFVIASQNRLGLTSPYGVVVGGSTWCHNFNNCVFGHYDHENDGGICLWIQDNCNQVNLNNCEFSNRATEVQALTGILIGHPDAWAQRCRLVSITGTDFETESAENTVRIIGRVEGLTIYGNELRARRSPIYANQAVYGLRLDNNRYYISGRDQDPEWNVNGHRPRVLIDGANVLASELNFRMYWTEARLDREAPFTGYTKSIQFVGGGAAGSKFIVHRTEDVENSTASTWQESPIEAVATFW